MCITCEVSTWFLSFGIFVLTPESVCEQMPNQKSLHELNTFHIYNSRNPLSRTQIVSITVLIGHYTSHTCNCGKWKMHLGNFRNPQFNFYFLTKIFFKLNEFFNWKKIKSHRYRADFQSMKWIYFCQCNGMSAIFFLLIL